MDERLREARDPLGRRRFYPPGAHPATQRLREERAKLLAFDPELPYVKAALKWVDFRLAGFEQAESEAKLRYLGRS